ncbi:FkbM family methyltransferase [Ensifer sp. ENS09]|uniref:FkbM family methyltransferase n=1 Tax=Ensifer sp. ENS09 TaxID=2769263 RepID=UPI001785C481|nr:FkbM family methyltransferase [Ensifer sp. ENS09]MBD9653119.1 FkbM family methyltransferase [Ensifer sp. ENS09]
MNKRTLPNGISITEINRYETDYLYKEIFIDNVYLPPFMTFGNGTIIDVGANIGLFSIFMALKFPQARILSFEPSPECARIYRLNTMPLVNTPILVECAAGNTKRTCVLYYYPGYTIMSSIVSNSVLDRTTLEMSARNQAQKMGAEFSESEMSLMIDALLSRRDPYRCEMRTISEEIEKNHISEIDLIKIDVEKAELLALDGITSADLLKTRNVIVEVHDLGGGEQFIARDRLRREGFSTKIEVQPGLEGLAIYSVYGWRT